MTTRDTQPTEGYLRIGDAARRLGVSVDTLRVWTDAGRISTRRTPGGQRMYDPADIASLLDSTSEGVSA